MNKARVKSVLAILFKFGLPLLIIGWLLASIDRDQLADLASQKKNWGMLLLSFGVALTAVSLTFFRWYLLVRAVEIPFRLADAFRLGFLGYMFNFVGAGSVGGDLFKAFFVAREHPGQKTKAVATVLVDRAFGLYALLLVSSCAIVLGSTSLQSPEMGMIAKVALFATALGALVILLLIIPGFTNGRGSRLLGSIPKVGPTVSQLISAVRLYRSKPQVLIVLMCISIIVHTLFAVAIFLAAASIYSDAPSPASHLVFVPLCMLVGTLPITPAGLGTFELALDRMYRLVAPSAVVSGVLVALIFRLMTIGIAAIGAIYYLGSRNAVREILAEAQGEQKNLTASSPADDSSARLPAASELASVSTAKHSVPR